MPEVSLLLPNRNNDRVLDLFFERLAANTGFRDVELIVVDDGSVDGSREVLRRWRDSGCFPSFTLVEKPAGGIVETLNVALERAAGEVIVRMDGDATVETAGWLELMLAFLRSDERVGVVTGRIVLDDGRLHSCGINVVGPEGVHDRGTRIREPVGRRSFDFEVDRPPADRVPECRARAEVDSAGGCLMMFPRELAQRIGGFDRRFSPVWVEDFDFALAARREGRKVFCLPEVEVVHRIGLRNPREDAGAGERALYRLRQRFGGLVPRPLRHAVAKAARLGHDDPAKRERLRRHYRAWHEKWGFDPVNPDLEELLRRWGHTEVCWAYDEERRQAGERILAAAGPVGSAP